MNRGLLGQVVKVIDSLSLSPSTRAPDKVCICISKMTISPPNPMFDHFLELSHRWNTFYKNFNSIWCKYECSSTVKPAWKTTSEKRPPLNKDHDSESPNGQFYWTKTTSQQRPHFLFSSGSLCSQNWLYLQWFNRQFDQNLLINEQEH